MKRDRQSRAGSIPEPAGHVTFSSILAALSFALDLTEGASPGHALRTCILGMRIGECLGLSDHRLGNLYFALLLKDAGCSSNASRLHQIVGSDERRAKRFTKTADWTRFEWKQLYFLRHVHAGDGVRGRVTAIGSMLKKSSENAEMLIRLRCDQGAAVVRDLGLGEETSDTISHLDEHWNGLGYPNRVSGQEIPLLARIVSLSQTLEVFHDAYGEKAALDVICRRSGRWFDPDLVQCVLSLSSRSLLWGGLDSPSLRDDVAALEPGGKSIPASPEAIDSICAAFARVIDAKSPSTYMHSTEVARIAVAIAECLNLPAGDITTLRRAALLHDIGKLGVPNSILDKPGKLTPSEWACIHSHPHYTFEILSRIPSFAQIASIAATHHEKLDGSGYYRGLKAADLSQMSRILTVADMFEALSADRPYRASLSKWEVMRILRKDAPHAIDETSLVALECVLDHGRQSPPVLPESLPRSLPVADAPFESGAALHATCG